MGVDYAVVLLSILCLNIHSPKSDETFIWNGINIGTMLQSQPTYINIFKNIRCKKITHNTGIT